MRKKFAIRSILGHLTHQSDGITDAMLFYVSVNPLSTIVRRSTIREARDGYISIDFQRKSSSIKHHEK